MRNKEYSLRFRVINRNIFLAIKSGEKKVETRAATVKYRNIKVGDIIEFVCGNEGFQRTVKSAKIYKSANALLKKHKLTDIIPNAKSVKDLENLYNSFLNYRKKLKKFGIIALEFKMDK